MSDVMDSVKIGGYVGEVVWDIDPVNPREFDNVAVMVCGHSRYDLGDVQVQSKDEGDYHISQEPGVTTVCTHCGVPVEYSGDGWWTEIDKENWDERDDLEDCTKSESGQHSPEFHGVSIYPLYLYDHGGITISMGGFSCPWDSGQVGVIYITDKDRTEKLGPEWQTPQKIKEFMGLEVDEYDAYLTGMVYRFQIHSDDGEPIISCGGYTDEEACKRDMMAEMEVL